MSIKTSLIITSNNKKEILKVRCLNLDISVKKKTENKMSPNLKEKELEEKLKEETLQSYKHKNPIKKVKTKVKDNLTEKTLKSYKQNLYLNRSQKMNLKQKESQCNIFYHKI